MADFKVSEGMQITLHFALRLEHGEEIDSNFGSVPPTFTFGDGSLLAGFERRLVGMKPGQSARFRVPPEEAFGQRNPNNIQQVSRGSFAADLSPEPGLVVSFADAAGGELPGTIADVSDSDVTVDFNHPLAGKTIMFDVKIIAVEPCMTH